MHQAGVQLFSVLGNHGAPDGRVRSSGLIYAGAQKNMGPAGLAVVIVRDDLVGQARAITPSCWDYRLMTESDSMLNTPPTFGIYLLGKVLHWVEGLGGLEAMGERNRAKAELLYGAIDASDFYTNPVEPSSRSWMNVVFTLADPSLDKEFASEAAEGGHAQPEGPPVGGRHARQHLQHADRGRRGARRLHGRVRAGPRLR